MFEALAEILRELARMAAEWLTARPRIRSLAIAGVVIFVLALAWSVTAALFDDSPRLDLARVSGSVTLDGQPLAGGIVRFAPDHGRGGGGPSGEGVIDATGRYEITTARQPGAAIGAHRVAVLAQPQLDPSQMAGSTVAVPTRYTRIETSGLVCEVAPRILNRFDISLVTPPPEPVEPKGKKQKGPQR